MSKKYEFTGKTRILFGRKLHQIRALKNIILFGVKAGDLGGWIEDEHNLSQDGDPAWIDKTSQAYGNALVRHSGYLGEGSFASDNALVEGFVSRNSVVHDNAIVFGNGTVTDRSEVGGRSLIFGTVSGNSFVLGNSCILEDAGVTNSSNILDNTIIGGVVIGCVVSGNSRIHTYVKGLGHNIFDASIENPSDYLEIGPINIRKVEGVFVHQTAILYRTPDGHVVTTGLYAGSIDEVEKELSALGNEGIEEREAMFSLFRSRIKKWEKEA